MTTPPIPPVAAPCDAHEQFLARVARSRPVPTDAAGAYLQAIAIAIAVADELDLRKQVEGAIRTEQLHAEDEAQRLQATAEEATLAATSPIVALYCKNNPAHAAENERWNPLSWAATRNKHALAWAIKQGILPEGTTALPDTEAQFLALAPWQLANNQG